jgi:hypothetical protein
MTGRPILIEPHGDRLHCHAIFESKLICRERGYKELDASALQRKSLYPGIPDIYVRVPWRRTDGNGGGATHGFTDYIIEVETDATKQSIARKKAQYDTSLKGHDLIVINLAKLNKANDLNTLRNYLETMIP